MRKWYPIFRTSSARARTLIVIGTFIGGLVCGLVVASIVPEHFLTELQQVSLVQNIFDQAQAAKSEPVKTELHTFEILKIPVGPFSGGGGALTSVGNYILFVTPKGKLGFVRRGSGDDYEVKYTDAVVPMRYEELKLSSLGKNPLFNKNWFRTQDLLPLKRQDGTFDLYVTHHRFAGHCIEFVVSRALLTASATGLTIDNGSWEDVFVAKPCIELKHNSYVFAGDQAGGRLAATSDGKLLVTVGGHDFDDLGETKSVSMDLQSHLGKIVELDPTSKISTIFASGVRNSQGLYISADGRIWETEHGPRGGDELNLLQRGENYGWPMASYGLPYRIREEGWPSDPSLGRHIGFTKPVFAFFPSIAISNLVEVQGDEFPLWRDDLLVTSLKDMAIWRLRRDGNRIVYSERFSLEHRLRDIVELPGGQLALLTDDGKVLILRNTSDADASQQQSQIRVVGLEAVSEVFSRAPENEKGQATSAAGGTDLFDHYCATCHAMSQVPMPGPHLSGVVGRRIGSLQDYPYSMAMQNAEGVWTEERLIDFLSGRREDFPGTTMPFVNIPRIKDYKLIVQYLKETRQ